MKYGSIFFGWTHYNIIGWRVACFRVLISYKNWLIGSGIRVNICNHKFRIRAFHVVVFNEDLSFSHKLALIKCLISRNPRINYSRSPNQKRYGHTHTQSSSVLLIKPSNNYPLRPLWNKIIFLASWLNYSVLVYFSIKEKEGYLLAIRSCGGRTALHSSSHNN